MSVSGHFGIFPLFQSARPKGSLIHIGSGLVVITWPASASVKDEYEERIAVFALNFDILVSPRNALLAGWGGVDAQNCTYLTG